MAPFVITLRRCLHRRPDRELSRSENKQEEMVNTRANLHDMAQEEPL